MNTFWGLIIFTCCTLLPAADIRKWIELTAMPWRFLILLPVPNALLLSLFLGAYPAYVRVAFMLLTAYTFLRFHLYPFRYNKSGNYRIRIMYGGRLLLNLGFWSILLQLFLCVLFYTEKLSFLILPEYGPLTPANNAADRWFLWNLGISCILFSGTLVYNGTLRILCTCRRLGLIKRLLLFCNMWVPFVNLFLMRYLSCKAEAEYAQECCRFELQCARSGRDLCGLFYPVIMVHGIGFRDLRYFNYWGRIPRELSCYGARVYYGHQNAWGTIEENAEALRLKLEAVLAETGAPKVNIIAHSKGGLDARYLISGMHLADRVASLTTINTPHRGSELIDILNRLPDRIYRLAASLLDSSYRRIGDLHPDCYHASKQLAPSFALDFNRKYQDAPGVYYQSYASVMKHFYSDSLLCIPYLLLKAVTGEKNDGLVTESSAKWGEFQGTFRNGKHRRGISHGDMIDLKREDYPGFDVIEKYFSIVCALKEKGF